MVGYFYCCDLCRVLSLDPGDLFFLLGAHAPGGHHCVRGVPEDGSRVPGHRATHQHKRDALGDHHGEGEIPGALFSVASHAVIKPRILATFMVKEKGKYLIMSVLFSSYYF